MTNAPKPPDAPAAGTTPAAPSPPNSCGWLSDLPGFFGASPRVVRLKLEQFVRDAGPEQVRAWDESIPWLQRECRELVDAYDAAANTLASSAAPTSSCSRTASSWCSS